MKRINDSAKTKFRSAENQTKSSSPNLLIESPNLLIRSFTSKAVSVSTRSYVIQELWILFSTAFNYIIFSVLRF